MSRTRTALLVSAAAGLVLTAPVSAFATGVPAPGPAGSGVTPAVPAAGSVVSGATQAVAPSRNTASAPRQSSGQALVGVFRLTSGACGSGKPSGSYFSMLDPSGGSVSNSDSPCSDKSATPLQAGTAGLSTQAFEPFGSNPGAANAIAKPASFFGSPFSVATQTPDKQTSQSVKVPTVSNSGGTLTGDLAAFQVFYNGMYYNQGSPKPGGAKPGRTTPTATGKYDASSGHYTLDWKSTISGGAFNNFTGVWHLEGTFVPSSTGQVSQNATSGTPATSTSGGATSGASTASAPTSTSTGSLPRTGPLWSPVVPFALLLPMLVTTWTRRWRRVRARA